VVLACCPCRAHDFGAAQAPGGLPVLIPRKAAPSGSEASFGDRLRQNDGPHCQEAPRRQRASEDSEQVTHEALPTRWVDLLLHLDEQERSTCAGSQPATGEEIVEAELAARDQEKVLRELIRTEEPTGEATALLEDLRQKVARAVAGRH
jgi:hypothetical protein